MTTMTRERWVKLVVVVVVGLLVVGVLGAFVLWQRGNDHVGCFLQDGSGYRVYGLLGGP